MMQFNFFYVETRYIEGTQIVLYFIKMHETISLFPFNNLLRLILFYVFCKKLNF